MSKRQLGVIALLIALFAVGYVLFAGDETEQRTGDRTGRDTPRVETVTADTASFTDRIESLGTLQARESVSIVSETTGIVEKLLFKEGEDVAAGTVLVQLEDREEDAEIGAVRAKVEEARNQYERVQDLVSRGVATRARLDEQTAALRRAEADLRVAQAKVRDRQVVAPFAGRLGIRRVSPGALVDPSVVITTLDDIDTLKLDFSVPETFLSSLAEGQRIEGETVAYPGRIFEGEVTIVGSRVDPRTRTVEIRALVPNPDYILRPGMLMTVDLFSQERSAVRVPEAAISPVEDKQYVFIVADGKAERREVEVGSRIAGFVEITRGLRAGEEIVVKGLQAVRDGIDVEVIRSADDTAAEGSRT